MSSKEKKCDHCAMMIPDDAKTCPYCRKSQGASLGTKIVIGFFGLMILSAMFGKGGTSSQSSPTTPAAASKASEEKTTRALAGAMTLKNAMRNPDSFKLTSATLMSNGTACYEYRSQNGFGGMNTGRAVLGSKGDTVITSEMDGFFKKWNKQCAGKSGKDIVDYLDLALK